ncbi:hypothetical protein J2Y67_004690 [Neobacillus niacini]|nr:hypothetical protein [Neobacillus niacini]
MVFTIYSGKSTPERRGLPVRYPWRHSITLWSVM